MSDSHHQVLNIAAYKFVALAPLQELRQKLREQGKRWQLKGSILLSPEGINMFLAGEADGVRAFLEALREDERFADLEVKESWTDEQPFRRFLVKLKREIIAFGIDEISPQKYTSPRLKPSELKDWLDQGKAVHLLDVRNDYEIQVGTFRNARSIGVDHFRDFPAAVEHLPPAWKKEPIVTFCTGGIRCEKAAPFMEKLGFENVYQLDGGILKYFEEIGQDHYDGECFVFDHRVTVDPGLESSDKQLCFACQAVLTAEDRQSPLYVPNKSCPHCHRDDMQLLAERIAKRQMQWAQVTTTLPGSLPYDHERPLRVSQRFSDLTVAEFLEAIKTHLSQQDWRAIIEAGQLCRQGVPLHSDDRVVAGDILIHRQPAHVEPPINVGLSFLFEDEDWIVVNKPAPLPVHPSGRFHRHTLTYLLDQVYSPQRIRLVHRLDAATTGVMILARHRRAAAVLQPLFEQGEMEKSYLVHVLGHPSADQFSCELAISSEPIDGLRRLDPAGLPAVTRFELRERRQDGTSVLEAFPSTGRTNQIRLHAWALGLPVVGDPMYLPERKTKSDADPATTNSPLGLHAWKLAFVHPRTGQKWHFEAPAPDWARHQQGD